MPLLADPVTVTDMRGKEISLPAPAERLAIIPIPMASAVIAPDGSTKHIAAMNPQAIKSVTDGFLGAIFPEAAAIHDHVNGGGGGRNGDHCDPERAAWSGYGGR